MVKLTEFLMMTLEKGMFSNKTNFSTFKENFFKVVDNENEMSIHKFVYLMSNMAEIIFPGEQNAILAIVNSYLSERHSVTEDRSNFSFFRSKNFSREAKINGLG